MLLSILIFLWVLVYFVLNDKENKGIHKDIYYLNKKIRRLERSFKRCGKHEM